MSTEIVHLGRKSNHINMMPKHKTPSSVELKMCLYLFGSS